MSIISLITGAGPVMRARFEHQFGDLGSYLSYLIYYYYTRNGISGQPILNISVDRDVGSIHRL